MAQTAIDREKIVQRMIDAGEPEENIATVIGHFKTLPADDIQAESPRVKTNVPPPTSPKTSGFSSGAETSEFPESEPDTYWGGFKKGLADYFGEVTSGVKPALESAARPETLSDMMNLVIPSELPHIARGALSGIANKIAGKSSAAREIPEVMSGAGNLDNIAESIRQPVTTQARPPGPWDANVAVGSEVAPKLSEDKIYDLARDKFNMGRDLPQEFQSTAERTNPFSRESLAKDKTAFDKPELTTQQQADEILSKSSQPKAEFLGLNQDGTPLFNVVGGASDKSTVGLDKLKELGIEVPEIPKDAKPVRGDDLRRMQQQRRSTAMDKSSKGYKGTVTEEVGFSNSADNLDLATLTPEIQQLNKTNQIGKMANEAQKKSLWGEVRDANRALLTSFDLSALARQGKPLMGTKAYWTSIDDMFKSWGSEKAYQSIMDSIHQHPNFVDSVSPLTGKAEKSLASRAGLDITGAEQFNSNIAEKLIPGVRPSERAYNGFLNKLRSDHFNTLIDDYKKSGIDITKDDTKLRALGSFINDATGKGSLGKLEKMAPILNEAFFAPKLMASRVNMYKRWLDPRTYGNADPIMRVQALKSLLSTVGFGLAVGELARLGGASISNDPRSADFRKIKIGNSRVDPFSGFQQYATGASRLLSGQTTSTKSGETSGLGVEQPLASMGLTQRYKSGEYGKPTRASVTGQFFQNKLAPVPSFIWSWMEGTDWDGKPFELKKAMLDRTVPIVMQDLKSIWEEDPKNFPAGIFKDNPTAAKVGMAALPIIGEGLQTYGR